MISNVSGQYTQNFTGAFLIDYTRAVKGLREYMETKALNNHKIVFPNWEGNPNCVFYITRDNKDFQVAEAIYRNREGLKAKYFPNINTFSGFDADFPKQVQAHVSLLPRSEYINGCKRILNYVSENRAHNRTKIYHLEKAMKKNPEKKILSQLDLFFETQRKKGKNGVVYYVDNAGRGGRVSISPRAKNGSYYVKFIDNGSNEVEKYFEFDRDGELIKPYTFSEAMEFYAKFRDSIRRYVNMNGLKNE